MGHGKLRLAYPFGQLALILIGIMILYLAIDFGRQVIVSHQRREDLREVEERVLAAQQRNEALQKQLEYAQSPEAAEAWARQQGWVKANEVPVVLVAPEAPAPVTGASEQEEIAAPTSNRWKWWDLFFGER